MTFDEFVAAVLAIAPDAVFGENPMTGEIDISSGLVDDGPNGVIPLSAS